MVSRCWPNSAGAGPSCCRWQQLRRNCKLLTRSTPSAKAAPPRLWACVRYSAPAASKVHATWPRTVGRTSKCAMGRADVVHAGYALCLLTQPNRAKRCCPMHMLVCKHDGHHEAVVMLGQRSATCWPSWRYSCCSTCCSLTSAATVHSPWHVQRGAPTAAQRSSARGCIVLRAASR